MLTAGYGDEPKLPQCDLVYVAFRLCYYDLITDLETDEYVELFDEVPYGFLTQIPLFSTVPPRVQIDLLASVWAKHHSPKAHPASLLDAAVLWSVFHDAGRIGIEVWEGDVSVVLDDGPRRVTVTMDDTLAESWEEMIDEFWDDEDFLSLGVMADMPPEQAKAFRQMFGIPEAWVDEMYAVLERVRPSPNALENLRGLLSDREIEQDRDLLLPDADRK
ncbi:MAG: hypothetical protein WD069_07300 [Planctomycetales bacterium]